MTPTAARHPSPSVTIAVPVRDEAARIASCLAAIEAQDYDGIIEILVIDGGSTDATAALASSFPKVTVIANPAGRKPAGLNRALIAAQGEVFVVVDGRTLIAPDYVTRCVAALEESGAFVVGGPMVGRGSGRIGKGAALALSSRLGAGPAPYRRPGGTARFVDTVYLGAFRTKALRVAGGFAESGAAADVEIALRAQQLGGAWLDPRIRSTYLVRDNLPALWRHWFRYGRIRARLARERPGSLGPRQLAAPLLVLGLLSPRRRLVGGAWLALLLGRAVLALAEDAETASGFLAVVPVMHLGWGLGFLAELVAPENWMAKP